jgi:16S rRNA (cytidine1402-2'-O)-methyltransferase
MKTTVFLIPCFLAEDANETIPVYVMESVKNAQVIFAENERTTRRFLKSMDRSISIDAFEWHTIHKTETDQINIQAFKAAITSGKNISIISEAGCPGVADPGQQLIAIAQEMGCFIKPLVGPSSILLALMASGMNGQQFEFIGYLPIENGERIKKIKELESSSLKNNSTKIFIETPYRNNPLLESLLQQCNDKTRLCIGVNITGKDETILTKRISDWKKNKPELHKKPVIFLLHADS